MWPWAAWAAGWGSHSTSHSRGLGPGDHCGPLQPRPSGDALIPCSEQLMQLYSARQRRRLNRGLRRKQHSLLKRLRKAKKEAPPMEKPEVVKTHLRDMIILPEMVGSMVGVYNGKTFNQVEIKVRIVQPWGAMEGGWEESERFVGVE